MDHISATIITLNEEKNIERCLNSLHGIADEIIIVDSGSTDNTIAICERYGARVVSRPFNGYGVQRQFATTLATHNYIIAIDADEALSEELRNHILEIKEQGFSHRVYAMPTVSYCMGRQVRHSDTESAPTRLFNKRYAQWNLRDVGERVTFPDSLRPETLHGTLHHYRWNDPDELYDKMHSQALIAAEVHRSKGGTTGPVTAAMKSAATYLRCLFKEGAILDGDTGRTIAAAKARAIRNAFRKEKTQCK